jgi:hypothetical protein
MEITIKISKEAFDEAVPAAKEPKGVVFRKLEGKINQAIVDIVEDKLGEAGLAFIAANPDCELEWTVKQLACVDVFLHEMRGLDLVLTGSGFGVVSTNDTAPASKMRVDALDGELRVKWLHLADRLLSLCFKVSGWYQQGLVVIDTLFCFFGYLKAFAGLQAPISKDWENAQQSILDADRWLRDKISDEFMDEMITQMATDSLTAKNRGIVHQVRRIIGMAVIGNKGTTYEYFRRLMNTLEGDLESFPTYANSSAFEANHFKPYENRKEDGAFHFVG